MTGSRQPSTSAIRSVGDLARISPPAHYSGDVSYPLCDSPPARRSARTDPTVRSEPIAQNQSSCQSRRVPAVRAVAEQRSRGNHRPQRQSSLEAVQCLRGRPAFLPAQVGGRRQHAGPARGRPELVRGVEGQGAHPRAVKGIDAPDASDQGAASSAGRGVRRRPRGTRCTSRARSVSVRYGHGPQ